MRNTTIESAKSNIKYSIESVPGRGHAITLHDEESNENQEGNFNLLKKLRWLKKEETDTLIIP